MLNLKLNNMKLSVLRSEFQLNDEEIIQALVNLSSRNPEKMVKGHNFFAKMILNITADVFPICQKSPDINDIESTLTNIQENSFIDIDCTALSKEDFEGKNDQESAEIIVNNADRVNLYLIVG